MKTIKNKLFLLALAAMPLTGNTQVTNLDFENWINPVDSGAIFDNRPVDWFLLNPGLTEPSDFGLFYHSPATDAQNGNYALKLSTWYYYTKDMALLKSAYTSRLGALKGFYKYEENSVVDGTDTVVDIAQISVFMTKWNSGTMHRDTIGTGILDLNGAANYTSFTNIVTYINSTIVPDSMHILLDPSLVRRDPNGSNYLATDDGIGSFLTVDNFSLIDENALGVNEFSQSVHVYPNPATDLLVIENFKGRATLFDLNGKLVHDQELENNGTISLNQLHAGIYLLQLNNGNQVQNQRIVKK
ncbi:T9SS type A sorting domain-containing protein [Fluviicola taffensis]|uniref:T9SS type A sorting domain-containing protein n=1 Tax=Fluviicola taffensis TaxID=191579 RepID=UPI003137FCBC